MTKENDKKLATFQKIQNASFSCSKTCFGAFETIRALVSCRAGFRHTDWFNHFNSQSEFFKPTQHKNELKILFMVFISTVAFKD